MVAYIIKTEPPEGPKVTFVSSQTRQDDSATLLHLRYRTPEVRSATQKATVCEKLLQRAEVISAWYERDLLVCIVPVTPSEREKIRRYKRRRITKHMADVVRNAVGAALSLDVM